MMIKQTLLIVAVSGLMVGCYSKRVERVERTVPQRTIVRDTPDIVIERHPPVVREKTTVIERN